MCVHPITGHESPEGAGWGWVNATPRPFYPGKETRYPLYRRLGGPQDRSGQVRKISPPPALLQLTIQPEASRSTDYAIQAHIYTYNF